MKIVHIMGLICVSLFAYTNSSLGATLIIQNGILMGAEGINVNGAIYDVSFQDGSCISLFNGCDEPSDFFFPDLTSAHEAGAALLEQVFIDTDEGQFDSIPGLTNGCGGINNDFVCNANMPIGDPPPSATRYFASFTRNRNLEHLDVSTGSGGGQSDVDFSSRDDLTFAIWSNPVPIPAAGWLFGSALLGLIGIAKRKQASSR